MIISPLLILCYMLSYLFQNVDALNDANNLRMKSMEGNRSTDTRSDNKIGDALADGDAGDLNQQDKSRMERQADAIRQGNYTTAFKEEARSEFRDADPSSWDDRKNEGEQRDLNGNR
eukprot:TRINITY_DN14589_c1_g1_i1.p1 TRINITY_DN14589_c1_g1~~TRINITY_DN14589_c1_g1_i1.p1  ORF type:complete len:117 (-),score=32.64 TRINITY_DN14589_c1_g1_i1:88-438(-)